LYEAAKHTESYQHLLKGSDRVVLSAAKSLGLHAKVMPILAPECPEPPYYINHHFQFIPEAFLDDDWWEGYVKSKGIKGDDDITWCQKLKHWQPAIVALYRGNDPLHIVCYQAAAILITIPKWEDRL
jgi:hypothetical protein